MSLKPIHKMLWYLRFKDLPKLIFVRDIRYAVIRSPISQGKASKWHHGIHLAKKRKLSLLLLLLNNYRFMKNRSQRHQANATTMILDMSFSVQES